MKTQQMHDVLLQLASRRPVFHSEADFQHALAWQLQIQDQNAHIRLEKQVATEGSRVHLDLLMRSDDCEIAVELKYKTRLSKFVCTEEAFQLRNQSAQDIGRHDFLKDVQRLEKYTEARAGSLGFAILLTNDRTYWTGSRKSDSVDAAFRIEEGRVLAGEAAWGAKASAGTMNKRETAIKLNGRYRASWRKYSSFGVGLADEFRYLLLRVPRDDQELA